MVAVAQLVEPWIVIPVVVGSSPISHPKFPILFPELLSDRLRICCGILLMRFHFEFQNGCRWLFYFPVKNIRNEQACYP